jgi:8-oxo-dGTP pyrophosphatase MutT (NUDIX family)
LIVRRAARVMLVDERGRVLLFCGQDPGNADAPPFWFTPGGGLDDGETVEEGARREVFEETGLALGELGDVVFERVAEFQFDGEQYRQSEQFFCTRVDWFDVVRDGWTDVEQRFMSEHRWWALEELRAATEVVYPTQLADLLERALG